MTLLLPSALVLLIPVTIGWWLYSNGHYARLAILVVLVLALAQPVITWEQRSSRISLLVDRSLSTRGEALAKAQQVADALVKQPNLELAVVGFGAGASLIASSLKTREDFTRLALQDESDLFAGLNLVAGLTPVDQPRSVLLLSDGRITGQDPLSLLPELRRKQLAIHYWPLTPPAQQDSAITQVFYAPQVRANQPFTVAVVIDAAQAQEAQLVLSQPPMPTAVSRESLQLNAGLNYLHFNWRIPQPGLQRYQLQLQLQATDAVPENNTVQLAIEAQGQPPLLVLNSGGKNTALVAALKSTGLAVTVSAGETALSSAQLRHYAVVVLENMPLTQLSDRADSALAHTVEQFGGGLMVTGGRQSYAMGGYYRSELEPLLPVTLERKQELLRPKLAVGIILDRSGSMAMNVDGGFTKMALANRAAVEALSLLAAEDELCVMAVDTSAHTVVNLQAIGAGVVQEAIAQRILSIESMGGGIFVYEGLRQMAACLLRSSAPNRHIILFADAADAEEPGRYEELITTWRQAGGTISVVGLGTTADGDAKLLEAIATQGGGRAFFTADPHNLPRIFAQDMIQVARNTFVEETTALIPAKGALVFAGLNTPIPPVQGYNLTYLAPQASLMLVTQDSHQAPLVAGWQRGAGKVMAITFEADGPHTGEFAQWPDYQHFFRQAVEWLKPQPTPVEYYADLRLQGRRAEVVLEFNPDKPLSGQPQATIIQPGEQNLLRLPLHWQGPGRLTTAFELGSDGIYHGLIRIPATPTPIPLVLPPRILPYSPEFALSRAAPVVSSLLPTLAKATGGTLFSHVDALTEAATLTSRQDKPLAPVLLGVALLLLLLEMGWRRGMWIIHWPWRKIIPLRHKMPRTAPQESSFGVGSTPIAPQSISSPITPDDDPLQWAKNKAKKQF